MPATAAADSYYYDPEYYDYGDELSENSESADDLDYPEEYYYYEDEEGYYYEEDTDFDITEGAAAPAEDVWVDIDLSAQTISVFSGEDNLLLASYCVTGMAGVYDTPVGEWTILDKKLDATLIGADYECSVGFWMPFTKNGCGIHDANWREDFSNDAYLYNGSHGCVNVGYDTASQIFDMVSCGTEVVVHY